MTMASPLANRFGYENFQERQHLVIPFHVPQREPGSASVETQPNRDPDRYGVSLLGPAVLGNLSVSETKGFPILNIKVASQSLGWAGYYGVIQVFATGDSGARLPQDLSNAAWAMDDHPIYDHVNTPFCEFGVHPEFFDAPFRDVQQVDWVARAFICYVPKAVIGKHVKPIFAVEWGFWIDGFTPYVKETRRLDIKVWDEHLDLLRSSFPGWTFDASAVAEPAPTVELHEAGQSP
ncbi:MAG: hypothetical protein M1821_000380 [Bathelium mastoideum]|nr:MAG: hypothetical protein M1821_000380 [Bathelium mastoideum]